MIISCDLFSINDIYLPGVRVNQFTLCYPVYDIYKEECYPLGSRIFKTGLKVNDECSGEAYHIVSDPSGFIFLWIDNLIKVCVWGGGVFGFE